MKEDRFYSKIFLLNNEEQREEYEKLLNDLYCNKKVYFSIIKDTVFCLRKEVFAEVEYIEFGEETVGDLLALQNSIPEEKFKSEERIEIKFLNKMLAEERQQYAELMEQQYKKKVQIEAIQEFRDDKMGFYWVYMRIRRKND